jgi:hypothetical protein
MISDPTTPTTVGIEAQYPARLALIPRLRNNSGSQLFRP